MQPAKSTTTWGRWGGRLSLAAAIFLTGGVLWEAGRVLLGANLHTVLAGEIYRGAQPTPNQLEQLVKKFGIRTVVNLRGLSNPSSWYLDQCRKIQQLGISQQDLNLSASRLPPAQEIRRLVEIIDNADYPIYFHCRRGADRTGLASVIATLLRTKCSFAEARGQLHWRYGHIPYGRLESMDEFFDLYTGWLEKQGSQHSDANFRHWMLHEYHGRCDYEVANFRKLPTVELARIPERDGFIDPERKCVNCATPIAFEVRLRNTGLRTWNFTTHSRSGFHLGYRVWDSSGKMVKEGRSCAREELVAPGALFTSTLVVPGELRPGRYRIMVDLVEETLAWCYQTGTEPMEGELEVCE
jgi:protein tyrosine phosphatase (PTP) superfamily phosphohydrolase (DUF442 family)